MTDVIDETKQLRDDAAECGIIGAMLMQPFLIDDVISIVKPEMFYSEPNGRLVGLMYEMHSANKKFDVTILVRELTKRNMLVGIGGSTFLAECMRDVQNPAFIKEYARIVRDLAIHRNVARSAAKLIELANDQNTECEDILSQADEMIYNLRDHYRVGSDRVRSMSSILHDSLRNLDQRRDGKMLGKPTGFTDLDKLMRMNDGDLIILAARPGMGKTAFAMNIADHISKTGSVLFVSLEMDGVSLADRLLSGASRVPFTKMRGGTYDNTERKKLLDTAGDISERNSFIIDDTPNRTVWDVAAVARREKRKGDLSLVVVDYLQLLTPTDKRVPRQEQVAAMTRGLKGMARELEVPVICLAQLNRQAETDTGNRPKLRHLRESGAIEQDADIVLFIHRDGYFDPKAPQGEAEILLSKQRNGMLGTANLVWLPEILRFENSAEHMVRENFNPDLESYNNG